MRPVAAGLYSVNPNKLILLCTRLQSLLACEFLMKLTRMNHAVFTDRLREGVTTVGQSNEF